MPGLIPNAGEKSLLELLRNGGAGQVKLKLFKNDVTVTDATVLSDLTECDWNGYSAVGNTYWDSVVTNGDGKAELKLSNYTFTKTAGGTSNTVYGYFIVFEAMMGGTSLIGVEKFDSARNMVNGGDSIPITATLTLSKVA